MEPDVYKKSRKFRYPRSPIIFEIACVLCVLGVALYFIMGASAHSGGPQGSSSSQPSLATSTATASPTATASGTVPPWNGPAVQILSVIPDNSSVKISFKPVAGAKDYRVFDILEPKVVKYAGMAHLEGGPFLMNPDGTPVFPFQVSPNGNGPTVLNIPYPQIEWNLLEDEQPHTLVVQAVNELGPVPPGNLYNDSNGPLNPLNNQSAVTLGMNQGPTPDGYVSTNGQGPSTDDPKVIAQSAPFIVQADSNYHAIPSTSSDTQTFFDTFADSEASAFKRTAYDPAADTATYTLNAGTDKAWTLQYVGADVRDSYPFINAGHFMDVLFDGGTPGTGNPLHTSFGYMTMSPDQTVDFSNGKVLHVTMEVDLHQDGRRWTGIELAPANDPFTSLDQEGNINKSDRGFFFDYNPGGCDASVYTGPGAGGGRPAGTSLWGALGQAQNWCNLTNFYWGGEGINLDNRGKLDLFITQNYVTLFINGQLAMESTIPGGLPFTQAKVYFTHYVYHTSNDHNELQQYRPWDTFWINYYSWSDERHWDNMGFEVFPASAASNSAAWQKLVAMPAAVSPKLAPTGSGSNKNTTFKNPLGSPIFADMPSPSLT